jgi:hypothetical protein
MIVSTEYRNKARKCRALAASADNKISKQLFFLAREYDAAACARERRYLPATADLKAHVTARRIPT